MAKTVAAVIVETLQAAGADALPTGKLAPCTGSRRPGSLHFINGLFESHRDRAPVVSIASQVVRDELGFDCPQEGEAGRVAGMALYPAKAVLDGRSDDVKGLIPNLLS